MKTPLLFRKKRETETGARAPARKELHPQLPFDDSIVLLCWLLGLVGAFGFTCWLCFRLFHMPPFVLVPPSLGGS